MIKKILLIVCVVGLALLSVKMFMIPKVAFVNSGKLMVGFSEAAKVEKELKSENEKWGAKYKILQDSIQATINVMTKEFDKMPVAKQKEFQDQLSARNQQANNFRLASQRRVEEIRVERMKAVFEKVNLYISEYGKKHRYIMIFGTLTGGNILYANEASVDITQDIIKGLNERYK